MANYILVVPSSAKAGKDDDYNRWYDETHLGDLLAIPGVKSGKRYDADPASPNTPDANYVAVYEIETDDPGAVMAELGRRAMAGEMEISPALDPASAKMWLYKAR
jgi:hypothetical protein